MFDDTEIKNQRIPILGAPPENAILAVIIYEDDEIVFVGRTDRNPNLFAYSKKEECHIAEGRGSFYHKQFSDDTEAANYLADLIVAFLPKYNNSMPKGQTVYYSAARAKTELGIEEEDFTRIHTSCKGFALGKSRYLTKEDLLASDLSSRIGVKYCPVDEKHIRLAKFLASLPSTFNDTALMGSFANPEEYTEFSQMLEDIFLVKPYEVVSAGAVHAVLDNGVESLTVGAKDLHPKKLKYIPHKMIVRAVLQEHLWEQNGDLLKKDGKTVVLKNNLWRKVKSGWAFL